MAWKIVETSDETLKTFVGQALVQKIDRKQQALTKPDEVINYVLDNSAGWYQQRKNTNEMKWTDFDFVYFSNGCCKIILYYLCKIIKEDE